MKQKHIAGLLDVIEVSDSSQIAIANQRPDIDRDLTFRMPLLNGLLLRHLLGILSYHKVPFPTMLPKHDAIRAGDQKLLWERLNAKALLFRSGPVQLERLALWLKGPSAGPEVGMLLQELVGQTFNPSYKATEESWVAAVTLDAAIRMKSPLKRIYWRVSGRVQRAKDVLACQVAGDKAAIHGTGVAIHNMVVALHAMKALYADIGTQRSLSAEEATLRCLPAPAAVVRQAVTAGTISGCPFRRGTLFIFHLGEALKQSADQDLIFQRGGWNQCPAEQWVPALLAGIWTRATRQSQGGSTRSSVLLSN